MPLTTEEGFTARTHDRIIGMIGQNYVRTGILTTEDGALLARLQNMRHTGDYDDFLDWTKEDVEPYISKVEDFIKKHKTIVGVV